MAMGAADRRPVYDPRYRLVETASLVVAGVAALGLLAVVATVAGHDGASYRETIAARDLASRNLLPALLAFGLAMLAVAGIAAWLVALEVSFRVTGPLHRFCRNLETVIEGRHHALVPIRDTDHLQRHWDDFHASVNAVRDYYAAMHGAVEELERLVHATNVDTKQLSQAIGDLKAMTTRAHC